MIKILTVLTLALTFLLPLNGNSQWTSQTSGTTMDLKSVHFPNESTGYAVGLSGTILKTVNSGSTWTILTAPVVQDLYKVLFIDDNVGFVFGDGGKIYKTTDGGLNWVSKVSGTTNAILTAYLFNNNTTIFVGGASGTIKKSTDAGETWSNVTSGTTEDINSISFDESTNSTGYFVGNNAVTAYVYKSTDSGSTWSAQMLTGNVFSFFGLSIIDANNAFFCGGASAILKTTNGGSNWSNINSNSANFYRSCLFSNSSTGYVVGGNGKIIKTVNGGTNYTVEASGTTSILNCISENSCGVFYVVGNGGVILKKGATITGMIDNYPTSQSGPLVVLPNNGVLANDSQSGVTVSVGTNVSNGTLVLGTDGSFVYNPNSGYTGNDLFTYIITDNCGNTSSPITVNINSTASIDESSFGNKFKLFQTENLLIFESNGSNITAIKMFDMCGKLVLSSSIHSLKQEIDIKSLNFAYYTIHVEFDDLKVSRLNFVKF